jgi:hypothetical protein
MTYRRDFFAESCFKIGSRKLGGLRVLNFDPSHTADPSYLPKMTTLLCIASRIEAAVTAYKSIQSFADKDEWKAKFKRELVSAHLHGVSTATFEIEKCHA